MPAPVRPFQHETRFNSTEVVRRCLKASDTSICRGQTTYPKRLCVHPTNDFAEAIRVNLVATICTQNSLFYWVNGSLDFLFIHSFFPLQEGFVLFN